MRRALLILLSSLWGASPLAAAPVRSAMVGSVTDGDTFRLTDGTRIRIADIDSSETDRRQAKCAAEVAIGLRQKAALEKLIGGATVEIMPVGRSWRRIVARVRWRDRDLGAELLRRGQAKLWLRGRPKPDWCG